ncbi:MAG: hypothetical protein MI750_09785 [Xanthomonadales bacterium]|nr:hypothetical protein [Xanthomonadales bacterium]
MKNSAGSHQALSLLVIACCFIALGYLYRRLALGTLEVWLSRQASGF